MAASADKVRNAARAARRASSPPHDDDADGDLILSDLHVVRNAPDEGDGANAGFTVYRWRDPPATDADGDLVLPRRRRRSKASGAPSMCAGPKTTVLEWRVTVRHMLAGTSLAAVGLQVWRAAPFLADYVWAHRGSLVTGRVVLELSAGCGLVGLVAAHAGAGRVFLTDAHDASLANAAHNAHACPPAVRARVRVRRLDWARADLSAEACGVEPYGWAADEASMLADKADTILCADCVYDVPAVEALLGAVRALLQRRRGACIALLSLERRLNFSMSTLAACPTPAHQRFRELLASAAEGEDGMAVLNARGRLAARQLSHAEVPPCMLRVERVPELELWELRWECDGHDAGRAGSGKRARRGTGRH